MSAPPPILAPTTLTPSYALSNQDRRSACTGYAACTGIVPPVVHLGNDNVSLGLDPEGPDDGAILDAARACPVDTITLIDEFEEQVWGSVAAGDR